MKKRILIRYIMALAIFWATASFASAQLCGSCKSLAQKILIDDQFGTADRPGAGNFDFADGLRLRNPLFVNQLRQLELPPGSGHFPSEDQIDELCAHATARCVDHVQQTVRREITALRDLGAPSGQLPEQPSILATLPKEPQENPVPSPRTHCHVVEEGDRIALQSLVSGNLVGTLHVEPTRNGFAAHFHSRDLDRAYTLASQLRGAQDPAAVLAQDPTVEAFFQTQDGHFIVRFRDVSNWVRIGREPAPDQVAVLDTATAARELAAGEFVRVELAQTPDQRVRIAANARGPPNMAQAVAVTAGTEELRGSFDAGMQVLYIPVNTLPASIRSDPALLARWFAPREAAAMRGEFAQSARYTVQQPVAPGSVVRFLQAGNHAQAGRLIAADPVRARQELDQHLRDGLELMDRLLAADRHVDAMEESRRLASVHGATPELLLRQGLSELSRGRAERTAEIANQVERPARLEQGLEGFYDEINRRLQNPGLSNIERGNLIRLAQLANARDLGAAVESSLHLEAERLHLELRLSQPTAKPAAMPEATAALLYVEDSPMLTMRDWSPPLQMQSLQDSISGDTAELLRLYHDAVAELQPDAIVVNEAKQVRRFRHVAHLHSELPGVEHPVFHRLKRHYRPWRLRRGTGNGTDSTSIQDIYEVLRATAAVGVACPISRHGNQAALGILVLPRPSQPIAPALVLRLRPKE